MNLNGKLFKDFLRRNLNLHLVNGTDKCKGSITRQRITKIRKEEKKKEEQLLRSFEIDEPLEKQSKIWLKEQNNTKFIQESTNK